jgi:hypothetical protein
MNRTTTLTRAFYIAAVSATLLTPLVTSCASHHNDQTESQPTSEPITDGVGNDQAQASPKPSPSTPKPTPRPVKANPDELAGLVTRFYRDLNNPGKLTLTDLGSILSPHFLSVHNSDWARAYGFIKEARASIDSVHGRSVNYTVDYAYLGDRGAKLTWQRVGTWYFVHGAATGWQMDGDDWKSIHITSLVDQNGAVYPVHDTTPSI